jgi:hypothetical protein
MSQTVTGIKIAGDRKIPGNTQLHITNPGIPGQGQVLLKLPWQKEFTDLGLLPIVNGEVILPLKLAFLCHAKEDKEQVEKIGSKLLLDGFLTWYDEKDLLPGDDWQRVIEQEIERCAFFLAFLSSRSCGKTGYVQRELRYALEQRDRRPFGKRFIIPILLDDCQPPRELGEIHFLRMWQRGAYDKLKAALTNQT